MAFLGLRVALRCRSNTARLIAIGCTTLLIGQSLMNLAVASGSMPTTGLPLPMVSYGGNSLLSSLLVAGLLIRCSLESTSSGVAGLVGGVRLKTDPGIHSIGGPSDPDPPAGTIHASFLTFATLDLSDLARSSEHLLQQALNQPGPLTLGLVFAGGALTSLGPCSLSLLPVTLAYLAGFEAKQPAWQRSLLFCSASSVLWGAGQPQWSGGADAGAGCGAHPGGAAGRCDGAELVRLIESPCLPDPTPCAGQSACPHR